MTDPPKPDTADLPNDSSGLYERALPRIRYCMLALAPVLCLGAGLRFGLRPAIGFLLGCTVSYLNFHWLESGISGLADRVTNTGKSQSGKGLIARFLLRYALLGVAAYAILTSFPASLGGFFAGMFLPVAGIVCEAIYELYLGMRTT